MSILVNSSEHYESVSKAAHRRSESNVTATYGHKAEINQHARGGGVRAAGSSTSVSIGNQRTIGGSGPASNASHRALVRSVKGPRLSPRARVAGGVALAGAGAAGLAHHRKVSKALGSPTSLASTAGLAAKQLKQGGKMGVRLAAKGHTHTGQLGTGVAGRPTFSVRPGTSPARRAGVHAGVAAGNAPTLAAGATLGAAAERHHVKKSAFGVDIGKALGDDTGIRGAVSSTYDAAKVPPAATTALRVKKITSSLGPAKSALLAAAKK